MSIYNMHGSITFANNADTFTTESITAETTVIPVIEKSTSVFPKIDTFKDQYFYLIIIHANDQSKYEYLKCTNITDDSFTVERGKEGTTPQNFPRDSRIINTLSTQGIYDVQEQSRLVRPHAETTTVYGSGTAQDYGHVKLTDNFELGTQAISGIICTPNALHQAIVRLVSLPKEQLFTTSTAWECPESGTYTITCVGGGGTGGTGGPGASHSCTQYAWGSDTVESFTTVRLAAGGGGGGGGAGQTLIKKIVCTKGTTYKLTVAGPGGSSIFGDSLVVAQPGGTGGTGGTGYAYAGGPGGWDGCSGSSVSGGSGGGGGTSYGSPAGVGGKGAVHSGGDWPCSEVFAWGGGGGYSTFGSGFGTGGSGGRSGGQQYHSRCYRNLVGPTGGTAGTQGCIKIVYPLGK